MRTEHEFPAFYRADSEILILGTIPSVKSREAGFYYMHPRNRFWRALSDVFKEEFPKDVEGRKDMLLRHKIALFDVLKSCEIKGSSDASIKKPVPNDIAEIIRQTDIKRVLVTGKTAEKLYKKYCEQSTGIRAEYIPSPSPANCALSYGALVQEYAKRLSCMRNL